MAEKASLLPFWSTVKMSYQLAWQHRIEYIKISWCWLVLAVPVLFLLGWLQQSILPYNVYCLDLNKIKETQGHIDLGMRSVLFSLVPSILVIFLGASVAVAWHRLILRDEKVAVPYYLRFDKLVLNYFMLVALIFCVTTLPTLVSLATGDTGIVAIVMLPIMIATIVFGVRVSVILPSRALGIDISIKEGWRKTKSNFWRLAFGDLLCFLPCLIISPVFIFLKTGCGSVALGAAAYTVNLLLYLIITLPIYLSFLSLSYQHFFESKEADAA